MIAEKTDEEPLWRWIIGAGLVQLRDDLLL